MAPPQSGDGGAAAAGDDLLETGLLAAAVSKEEEALAPKTVSTSGRLADEQGTAATSSSRVRRGARLAAAQLQEVFLGTRLFPLFSAVPLAVAAQHLRLGRAWVFVFSLIGLAPLAERVSFLSE